jgi:hypothetical protein
VVAETIRCLKKGVTRAMHPEMSKATRDEVLAKLRRHYARAGQAYKTKLLDQVIDLFGYHRKAAIRALCRWAPPPAPGPHVLGRPKTYHPDKLLPPLKTIWLTAHQPCGKLLVAALPEWVPAYEVYHRRLDAEVREQLLGVSAATLDRLLAPLRARYHKPRTGTKPGTLLRQQIPVRGGLWEEDKPGYLELDTVALCGGRLDDRHAWMLDGVDICTGWVEARALENRGEHATLAQLADVEQSLPFALLGVDSDNGSEFLNWHLLRHWQQRQRPVTVTRSRPYHKDDNAHVEQKNYTRIRQWFGYERYDNPAVVPLLSALCRGAWGQLLNFFCPTLKLEEKKLEGSRIVRRYEPRPQTPLARVLASPHVAAAKKDELQALKARLNPFALRAQVERDLRVIEAQRCLDNG